MFNAKKKQIRDLTIRLHKAEIKAIKLADQVEELERENQSLSTHLTFNVAELMELETAYDELVEDLEHMKAVDNSRKLDADDIELIHDFYADGESQRQIADRFEVHPSTISRVLNGKTHVS